MGRMTYKDKKQSWPIRYKNGDSVTENTWKFKMKKRWKMMKRNSTTKQGKAYIVMYKKPVK